MASKRDTVHIKYIMTSAGMKASNRYGTENKTKEITNLDYCTTPEAIAWVCRWKRRTTGARADVKRASKWVMLVNKMGKERWAARW